MAQREECAHRWVPETKLWPFVRVQAPWFPDSYWTSLRPNGSLLTVSLFLKTMFYVEILRRTMFHWGPFSPPPADVKHLYFSHWLHELWRLNAIVLILNVFLFLFEMNSWTHFVLMLRNPCSKITALAFPIIPCRIPPFTLLLNYIAKI